MTLAGFVLVGVCSFLIATVASLAGYGSGLIMPLVLVPLIGAQAVVPILAVAALFNNGSRIAAFRDEIRWPEAIRLMLASVPTCVVAALFYTRLDADQAAVVIGAMLILIVPGRRILSRFVRSGIPAASLVGGAIYGLLTGTAPGAGVVLIPVLMSMGLAGKAVVATDAAVSLVVGLVKVSTFHVVGAMPPASWVIALVIGICGLPGAFVARSMMDRMHARVHETILDIGVSAGGTILVLRGLHYL
jgi:uncharacterized membrane protein YfcA